MGKETCRQALWNLCIIFCFGMVLGCICVNVLWRIRGDFFGQNWMTVMYQMQLQIESLSYIPSTRAVIILIIPIGVMILLGFWKHGKVLVEGMWLCTGFLLGGIESVWILNCNVRDGLWFTGMLLLKGLPIIVFLFPAILISVMMSKTVLLEGGCKKWVKYYTFYAFFVLLLPLVYIIFLNYVNLKK